MSKQNEQTIEVYEKFGNKYLERNINDVLNNEKAKRINEEHIEYLKNILKEVPKNAKIFEVGSAKLNY